MGTWSVLIGAHAVAAAAAVGLGAVQLVRRPRGDVLHRRLGRVWMILMYWVCLSSFGIRELTPGRFSWIHLLSLWTLLSLSLALFFAVRHDIRRHRGWVVGSYFGLLGAGVAAMAFPQRLVPQTALHHPEQLAAGLAAALALSALVVLGASRSAGQATSGPTPSQPARMNR